MDWAGTESLHTRGVCYLVYTPKISRPPNDEQQLWAHVRPLSIGLTMDHWSATVAVCDTIGHIITAHYASPAEDLARSPTGKVLACVVSRHPERLGERWVTG